MQKRIRSLLKLRFLHKKQNAKNDMLAYFAKVTCITLKGFLVRYVLKLATFFKNIVFEKLESQFTIIKYADIVN